MQIDAVAVNFVRRPLQSKPCSLNPVISSRFSVPSWFVLTT